MRTLLFYFLLNVCCVSVPCTVFFDLKLIACCISVLLTAFFSFPADFFVR